MAENPYASKHAEARSRREITEDRLRDVHEWIEAKGADGAFYPHKRAEYEAEIAELKSKAKKLSAELENDRAQEQHFGKLRYDWDREQREGRELGKSDPDHEPSR